MIKYNLDCDSVKRQLELQSKISSNVNNLQQISYAKKSLKQTRYAENVIRAEYILLRMNNILPVCLVLISVDLIVY